VEAQIAYSRRQFEPAAEAASRALAANRSGADREETANSLRLLGASLIERNVAEKAEAPLREALDIDKDLALSPRILRDLMLLGRAAQARGDAAAARGYFARALAVARAAKDERSVAELTRLAASLPH
jgi:tetratricopeptide (TPR) repeat protein